MKLPLLLHSNVQGSGPVVVLLHGYLASSRYWDRVVSRLAINHRVISLDLLGFGDSPKPARSRYDYDAQIASIDATLKYLDVRGKFSLAGHSMGALLALRYAREQPDRVQKLTLANMPVFLNAAEAKRDVMGKNLLRQIGLRRGLHDIVWSLYFVGARLRLLPVKFTEGIIGRQKYIFQSRGYSRLRSMRNVIFAATIEADLMRLEMQTTLISGLSDRKQYLVNLPKLRRASNINSYVVDGGHHLPLTNPALMQQLIG